MRMIAGLGCALALLGLVSTSSVRAQTCVGDCGGTGMVRINDLILGVNISLGLQPADACPPFQNAEGEVTIAQLIKGVNNSLGGCTTATTLTPTNTIGVPTAPATATVTATATIG